MVRFWLTRAPKSVHESPLLFPKSYITAGTDAKLIGYSRDIKATLDISSIEQASITTKVDSGYFGLNIGQLRHDIHLIRYIHSGPTCAQLIASSFFHDNVLDAHRLVFLAAPSKDSRDRYTWLVTKKVKRGNFTGGNEFLRNVRIRDFRDDLDVIIHCQ